MSHSSPSKEEYIPEKKESRDLERLVEEAKELKNKDDRESLEHKFKIIKEAEERGLIDDLLKEVPELRLEYDIYTFEKKLFPKAKEAKSKKERLEILIEIAKLGEHYLDRLLESLPDYQEVLKEYKSSVTELLKEIKKAEEEGKEEKKRKLLKELAELGFLDLLVKEYHYFQEEKELAEQINPLSKKINQETENKIRRYLIGLSPEDFLEEAQKTVGEVAVDIKALDLKDIPVRDYQHILIETAAEKGILKRGDKNLYSISAFKKIIDKEYIYQTTVEFYNNSILHQFLKEYLKDDPAATRLIFEIEELGKKNTHLEYTGHAYFDAHEMRYKMTKFPDQWFKYALAESTKDTGRKTIGSSPHVFFGHREVFRWDKYGRPIVDDEGRVVSVITGSTMDRYHKAMLRVAFRGQRWGRIAEHSQPRLASRVLGGTEDNINHDGYLWGDLFDFRRIKQAWQEWPGVIRAAWEKIGGKGIFKFELVDTNKLKEDGSVNRDYTIQFIGIFDERDYKGFTIEEWQEQGINVDEFSPDQVEEVKPGVYRIEPGFYRRTKVGWKLEIKGGECEGA